jgi:hypothetical protein
VDNSVSGICCTENDFAGADIKVFVQQRESESLMFIVAEKDRTQAQNISPVFAQEFPRHVELVELVKRPRIIRRNAGLHCLSFLDVGRFALPDRAILIVRVTEDATGCRRRDPVIGSKLSRDGWHRVAPFLSVPQW